MTPETPNDDPLLKFIAFTQASKWEFDTYQIADILWLWQQQQSYSDTEDPTIAELQDPDPSTTPTESKLDSSASNSPPTPQTGELPTYPPDRLPAILKSEEKEESNTPSIEKLPISIPDTAFLRDTLKLGRFARPLIQKIDSATQQELNIKRTIANTAEYSVGNVGKNRHNLTIIPDYKPKKVRSLDLILIVEEYASMIFWKQMSLEIRDWLEQLGAFRDIKLYRMGCYENTQKKIESKQHRASKKNNKYPEFEIQIKTFENDLQTIPHKDLIEPRGERLILFFSDCTSPAWYNSRYDRLLKEWGNHQLVTLLSPFPEKLWDRTALNQGWRVQLQNDRPRRPTQQWNIKTIPELLEIELEIKYEQEPNKQPNDLNEYISEHIRKTYFPLPILSLTSDSLAAWSQVVNGNSKAAVAGRLLKSSPSKAISPDRKISSKNDPEIVIKRFASTASPFAWELMKKLSAVPINLPIIRLIQQQLLPHSTFVDAVEVILSGLLKTDREMDFHINPNLLEFEFIDGIRDILLKSYLRKTRSIEVIRVLSDYVAKKLGLTTRQFEAQLLTNPTQWKGKPEESLVRPFATIAAEVFGKLGEEYAQLATQIKYSSEQLRKKVIPPPPNFPQDSNWLTFLKKIVRQYKLTAIEIETLITLFPNPQQSLSITDAAYRLSCSRSAFSSRLSRIYRKFETLTPNLFSSNINKLNTLHQYLISQYQISPLPEIPELETLESFEFEAEVVTIVEKEKPLQQWTFDTPTVNRRGETIKTAPHTASYFTETLTDSVGIEMVAIPGGTFTMGSPENEKGRYDDESLQHQVTVSPFFMGKYPITQAQWKAIALRTELKVEIDLEPDPSEFKGDNRPVEQVNWYEAVEFCQRLSRLTGRDYRLPSEAQWEYACRGVREPLNLENGESYPPFYFGETISEKLANYDASVYADEPEGEYRGKTTPVGQFPPNAFGLYDLHGNVWEWCADDWHDNYEGALTDGSAWLDSNERSNTDQENQSYYDKNNENDSYSVMRGGSWNDNPSLCRSAARYGDDRREYRLNYDGLRVVCRFGRTLF